MRRLAAANKMAIALVLGLALVVVVWQWPARASLVPAAGAVAATLLGGIYLVLAGRLLARVLWRVALALVPLVALAGVVVGYVILPDEGLKDVRSALIAGTVIATGWLAAFLANEYQRAREREQTRRDVLLALRSEVFAAVEKLDKDDIHANAEEVQQKIVSAGNGGDAYHPFSASESPPIVYQAVSGSIAVLNAETLEPVLRFYAAYSDLTAMVDDMRSEAFGKLSAERRIAFHKGLTQNRVATLGWGLTAVEAVNLALGVVDPGKIGRSGMNPDLTTIKPNPEEQA